MAKKKLQAGGNTPKNNLDLLSELPYGMMTESDRRFQRNYVTRENDPYSNISFRTGQKDNPNYNRGDNFVLEDPIQIGIEQYRPTRELQPGDLGYVAPTLNISPDEEII